MDFIENRPVRHSRDIRFTRTIISGFHGSHLRCYRLPSGATIWPLGGT
jgi:hypothetical protein